MLKKFSSSAYNTSKDSNIAYTLWMTENQYFSLVIEAENFCRTAQGIPWLNSGVRFAFGNTPQKCLIFFGSKIEISNPNKPIQLRLKKIKFSSIQTCSKKIRSEDFDSIERIFWQKMISLTPKKVFDLFREQDGNFHSK